MLDRLADRVARLQRVFSRATVLPFLVRVGIALSFILATAVAWPAEVAFAQVGVLLFLLCLYPAFAPRGRATTFLILIVVAGWIVDTTWYGERVALWRVLAIATLIYLGHTLAALAAVLPYDSVANMNVLINWLVRAGAAVLISAVLTVVALGLTNALAGSAFLVATLIGLAAAVAATLLLTRLLRRP
jgi:hypothetical protein